MGTIKVPDGSHQANEKAGRVAFTGKQPDGPLLASVTLCITSLRLTFAAFGGDCCPANPALIGLFQKQPAEPDISWFGTMTVPIVLYLPRPLAQKLDLSTKDD